MGYTIKYGNVAYLVRTAYKPEYSSFSPGLVLFWFISRYYLDNENIFLMDYQRGLQTYKLRYGGEIYEKRIEFLIGNPHQIKSRIVLYFERNIVPGLRRLKKILLEVKRRTRTVYERLLGLVKNIKP